MQMFCVTQIDVNQQTVEIWLAVDELQVRDIRLLLADQGADAAQHTGVIADGEVQRRGVDRRSMSRSTAAIATDCTSSG